MKLRVLAKLHNAGVGYCSQEACFQDDCGTEMTWEMVLDLDIKLLEELAEKFL